MIRIISSPIARVPEMFSGLLPLHICLEYSQEQETLPSIKIPIQLAYSEEDFPEIYFIDRTNPCIQTYPFRRLTKEEVSLDIKILGHFDSIKNSKLKIEPNYLQLIRESIISQKWFIWIQGLVTISLFMHFNLANFNDQS